MGEPELYQQRLRELTNEVSTDEHLGVFSAIQMVLSELSHLEGLATNVNTTETFFEKWVENIRDNLPLIDFTVNQDLRKDMKVNDCIVVGAGPSITDGQLRALQDYTGTIICVNKIYKRLMTFREPHLLVMLHTSEEILPHFQDTFMDIYTKVLIPTTIHPKVARRICEITRRAYWFNASTPDALGGADKVIHILTRRRLQTIDAGGNVGIFGMVMAKELGAKNIGMLGMEHCIAPDPAWSSEQSLAYTHLFSPEQNEFVTITPMFKGYLNSIIGWSKQIKETTKLFNLTAKGLLYIDRKRIGIPYMNVAEYVREHGQQ